MLLTVPIMMDVIKKLREYINNWDGEYYVRQVLYCHNNIADAFIQ
jgi:hypothetical protein